MNSKVVCLIASAIVMSYANAAPIKNQPTAPSMELMPLAQVSTKEHIAQAQQKLAYQREFYQEYFNQAYLTYPAIPAGMLETLAYVASRWEHRKPVAAHQHHHMPESIGLFGLYDDNDAGFANTLTQVAKHSNLNKKQLIQHPESYIMATAAYIADQLHSKAQTGHTLASSTDLLIKLSGLPQSDSNISRYANNSYLYDFFQTVAQGRDEFGIKIKAQPVKWQQVFTSEQLLKLRAPKLVIDTAIDQIKLATDSDTNSKPLVQTRSSDYGPAIWSPSPNYSSRNGRGISHITIHTTQGSYAGSISWLKNPAANASAHYVIRSSDGQVTQLVRDHHKAWHARSANPYTIGIEHEGYVSNPAWYTGSMYNSSANLTKHLCNRHGINCNNAYNGVGHSYVYQLSQGYTVKGHQHFPGQTHTDPGVFWDWAGYHHKLTR